MSPTGPTAPEEPFDPSKVIENNITLEPPWIDGFIGELLKSQETNYKIKYRDNFSGQEIWVKIGKDMLNLLLANRHRLGKIGKNVFKEALQLFSKAQDFDALMKIYEELDTSDLIDKYKENAAKMAEIAQEIQEDRAFWLSFAKQAATKLVFSALAALL